ncbi:hypothetical protein [Patulibacter defluvii]|uniref:hypothetical protein n=1 Tax=Patulibacter defluvii TaxID=3095358 RepID=UPI002A761542|nr:hypothetical protein [Patulibacter sp. DM4]
MARLKLSPSGLRSPLDLTVPTEEEPSAPVALAPAPTLAPVPDAPVADAPAVDAASAPRPVAAVAADAEAPVAPAAPAAAAAVAAAPTETEAETEAPAEVEAEVKTEAAAETPAPATADDDRPAWTAGLDAAALRPDRLLGRPKQTALILDRELSARADALVAATGPRVTFAALVTAVLHFHLPADGDAAARAIGGYRRRRLEALDHPWEERNARVPEALRRELDDVVAGATGIVASVRRSTLVNALLDAHLPEDADDAARLVTRMEMVRGGAFLD